MRRYSPRRNLSGLFAGSPYCWHGPLLNSGRRFYLVPAERHEGWEQAIRLDPFENQGTGFAFEPHIKKILLLGVCGFVVRGRRGGQRLYRCPRPDRPLRRQANCPHIHGPSACRSALQSASSAAESVPIGSRPIARGQSSRREFRGQLSMQLTSNYFNAPTRSLSVTFPD